MLFALLGQITVPNIALFVDAIVWLAKVKHTIELIADPVWWEAMDHVVGRHQGAEHVVTFPATLQVPIDEEPRFIAFLRHLMHHLRRAPRGYRRPIGFEVGQKIQSADGRKPHAGTAQKFPATEEAGISRMLARSRTENDLVGNSTLRYSLGTKISHLCISPYLVALFLMNLAVRHAGLCALLSALPG